MPLSASGPSRAARADQRLGIRDPFAVNAAEGAIDQAAPDFALALGEAPVIEVLEDQHPEDDDDGRAEPAARRTQGRRPRSAASTRSTTSSSSRTASISRRVSSQSLSPSGSSTSMRFRCRSGAPDHGSSAEAEGFRDGPLGMSRAAAGAGHRVPARSAVVLARPRHPRGSRAATPAAHRRHESARPGPGSSGRDGDHAQAPRHSDTPAGRSGGRFRRGCQRQCGGRAGGAAAAARVVTAGSSSPMTSVTSLAWSHECRQGKTAHLDGFTGGGPVRNHVELAAFCTGK